MALGLTGCDKPLFTQIPASHSGITFANRIVENDTMNILDFEYVYNGGGTAIGDFNNDGLQDVFFTGNQAENRLYLNKGNFTFDDITQASGLSKKGKWCAGVALVDINNDGWMDIYVGATVSKSASERENLLFVNQGAKSGGIPTFREMARDYGIADDGHSTNAAFFDYDNDGDLDLYVLTNTIQGYPSAYREKVLDGSSPTTDRLYRNEGIDPAKGHPVFRNVSAQAGILAEGYGLGINITDINRDGWKDIYVTNDYVTDDLLYMNNGDGTFTNRAQSIFKHTSSSAMGNDVADINNDGWMDMVAVDMLPRDNVRKKMLVGPNNYQTYLNNEEYQYGYQYVRNTLQLNQGFRPGTREPIFSDISLMADVAETDWSWTPLLVDFDHDGYRDLLVTNGFPKDITDRDFANFRADNGRIASKDFQLSQIPVIKISNYAFRNNGDLTFSDVTKDWGMDVPSFSNGAAYGDLDNDGDLDFVVNNINDSAFVFRNNLVEKKPEQAHYLRLKFFGSEQNRMGLGAIVELRYGKGADGKPLHQVYEHTVYRGYLSTVENAAHFGLGAHATIDELRITWPNGKSQTLRNVKTNQVLTVDFRRATESAVLPPTPPAGTLFRDVTDSVNLKLVHQEPEFIDFNQQKLLPHKLSQYAPALAVGDLNGDGLEDMVMGGSSRKPALIAIQQPNGRFVQKPLADSTNKAEDMGVLLFDADQDTDLDLYISSGSYEGEPNAPIFQDRFYLNDGKGNFQPAPGALPKNLTSKSCVKAADFDRDGDLDLFIGGRVVPNQYPRPVSSQLLRNDSRPGQPRFTDVTPTAAKDLINIGLVCDALWTDYDNDGWPDLLLAGEWMPLTFLKNTNGKLSKADESLLPKLPGSDVPAVGWWNSLLAADFDRDGDTDYIAGNFGTNSLNRASQEEPVAVYAKDFDNNGFYDAIPSVYFPDGEGVRREFPFHGREDLIKQMIVMRGRFPYFKDFAAASMDKLLKPDELKDAIILKANYLKSVYVENQGNGQFLLQPLPTEAQVAPIFGMMADDFDSDGHTDLLLVGNDYSNEVFVGRMDAFNGLFMKGDGKGAFTPTAAANSGFYVPGNAKGLVRLTLGDGTPLVVVTQNRGPVKAFQTPRPAHRLRLQPTDMAAVLTYADGRKQKWEFCYGQSFLSQTSRELLLTNRVQSAEIINSKGQKRQVPVAALAGR